MSTGAAGVLAWTGAMTTAPAGLAPLRKGLLPPDRPWTAADPPPLAPGDALAAASGDPCAVAAEAAVRNEATLVSCEVRDWDVLVRVEVDASPLGALGARSRAGPGPAELP